MEPVMNARKVNVEDKNELNESDDDKKSKRKKKRSQKKSVLADIINEDDTPMSEGLMGSNQMIQNECPFIDAIEKRCRGIDILSGDTHQYLLEACGAHQLCYLCVSIAMTIIP
jgi:hypothetical protein